MAVVLFLLFLASFIAFIVGLVKPKLVLPKKISKRVYALIYLIVSFMFLGISIGLMSSDAAANFASSSPTNQNVQTALSGDSKLNSVSVEGTTVTVTDYTDSVLTLKSYVQLNQSDSADVFEKVFKNKKVSKVIYVSKIGETDSYGKTIKVTALTSTMLRADADKVSSWDTFKFEDAKQYYGVVDCATALDSQVNGLSAAWTQNLLG